MTDYVVFIEGVIGDYVLDKKHPFSRVESILNVNSDAEAYNIAREIKKKVEINLFLPHVEISRLTALGRDINLDTYKK